MPLGATSVAPSRSSSMATDHLRPVRSREPATPATDRELVDAVTRRDQTALEEIHRRHGAAVFGLARRVLRRDDLAEDITQDVFVRLWNEPRRFDAGRGSLRSFLQREAHSRSIERVRSEESRARREQRSNPIDDGAPSLEAEVLASIRSEELRRALDDLDSDTRNAIVLAYYGGLSYRQVAEQLDQPEGTVKSRIRAGLNRLSTLLDDGTEVGA
jgi:RNA polymerase sigma-70 factor, ECF subfamily